MCQISQSIVDSTFDEKKNDFSMNSFHFLFGFWNWIYENHWIKSSSKMENNNNSSNNILLNGRSSAMMSTANSNKGEFNSWNFFSFTKICTFLFPLGFAWLCRINRNRLFEISFGFTLILVNTFIFVLLFE